jgi:CO dehydrogenase nickel-insertion accessory protein CooC1
MLIVCRSPKGGSGSTVTAAALALLLATRHRGGGYVVDLAGDLPAALGLPEPRDSRSCEVNSALQLLPRAQHNGASRTPGEWRDLGNELRSLQGPVVVDAGVVPVDPQFEKAADLRLMVVRPCYLALRRAATMKQAEDNQHNGVLVVNEPSRALTPNDVETVLRVPVRGVIPFDPSVARAVDAGLLAHRVPKVLEEGLSDLIASLTPHSGD